MKELSIEEKAKRYDEALKVLHKYDGANIMFSQSLKEEMFPELKENEDNTIRKEIISAINLYCTTYFRGDIRDKMLAWVKRQDEHKPADKIAPKFKVGQTIKKEGFNLGFTIVKIEDGFYYNDTGSNFPFTDQDNWELVEQKPAWSEEDEKMIEAALQFAHEYGRHGLWCWLKSLKDRVQPLEKISQLQKKIQIMHEMYNEVLNKYYKQEERIKVLSMGKV